MSNLVQDLRFALRSFIRAPRFSVPAILALALGIGVLGFRRRAVIHGLEDFFDGAHNDQAMA